MTGQEKCDLLKQVSAE